MLLSQEWLDKNFPTKNRLQMVLIKSDNILTPHSLKKVRNILDRYRHPQPISSVSALDV